MSVWKGKLIINCGSSILPRTFLPIAPLEQLNCLETLRLFQDVLNYLKDKLDTSKVAKEIYPWETH
jgi:hypothetical protein